MKISTTWLISNIKKAKQNKSGLISQILNKAVIYLFIIIIIDFLAQESEEMFLASLFLLRLLKKEMVLSMLKNKNFVSFNN